MFDASTAGDFHTHHRQTPNIIPRDNLGQLIRIIAGIQLRTADQHDPVPDKVFMETAIGICGAVRRYQQICTVKYGAFTGASLIWTGHCVSCEIPPSSFCIFLFLFSRTAVSS